MPYSSDRQRRFMHAQHPQVAERWDEEIRRRREGARREHQKRRTDGDPTVGKSLAFGDGGNVVARRAAADVEEEKAGLPTVGISKGTQQPQDSKSARVRGDAPPAARRTAGDYPADDLLTFTGLAKRARHHDPEDARQRRLGAGIASLGLVGGALAARGAKGVRAATTDVRRSVATNHRFKDKELYRTTREGGKIKSNKPWGLTSSENERAGRLARGNQKASGRLYSARGKDVAQLAGGTAAMGAAAAANQRARGGRNRRWT